jgi:hypothetical protein
MTTIAQAATCNVSRRAKWQIMAGRALSGLTILALALDAGGKLILPQIMIADTPPLGIPADVGLYRLLGCILAACTILYAVARTAVLGAILLTGFLGGAVAVNMRAEMPLFGNTLFGVYLGVMVWGGLLLRKPEIARFLGIGSDGS